MLYLIYLAFQLTSAIHIMTSELGKLRKEHIHYNYQHIHYDYQCILLT